ncbi:MAG: hypothetical protein H6730_27910 [Deltaproteobacteria bacterium]|nr:hypothetical protein [Deltaproteobacteria bacterium]
MRRIGSTALAAALSLLGVGCLDPLPNPPVDGGVVDEACLAQEGVDSGVLVTDCDPAQGTRCDISRHQACVWDVLADDGVCMCASVRVGLEEPCDMARQDCEPGTTCLFFATDDTPRCRSVCNQDDGAGCEALVAANPGRAFACAPVRRGPDGAATTNYGVCLDVGATCDPLNDTCGVDEVCSLLGRTTACALRGTTALGEQCTSEPCDRGGLCVGLADTMGNELPPTCYQPCAVVNPTCITGQCLDVGLEFGICL